MDENPPRKMWPYLLSGVAIGSAIGMIMAPKKGKEFRKDVKDWLHQGREKSRGLAAKLRKLPLKKTHLLAAIRAGREALRSNHNHHKRHVVHV